MLKNDWECQNGKSRALNTALVSKFGHLFCLHRISSHAHDRRLFKCLGFVFLPLCTIQKAASEWSLRSALWPQSVSQACPINSCFRNSTKCDIIIINNGCADPSARYSVFLVDSVIGSLISLSSQVACSFYLVPTFACLLVYSVISGHYIFKNLSLIF